MWSVDQLEAALSADVYCPTGPESDASAIESICCDCGVEMFQHSFRQTDQAARKSASRRVCAFCRDLRMPLRAIHGDRLKLFWGPALCQRALCRLSSRIGFELRSPFATPDQHHASLSIIDDIARRIQLLEAIFGSSHPTALVNAVFAAIAVENRCRGKVISGTLERNIRFWPTDAWPTCEPNDAESALAFIESSEARSRHRFSDRKPAVRTRHTESAGAGFQNRQGLVV